MAKHKEAVILRISIYEQPRETRFMLEGKLAGEWVPEAEKAWGSIEIAGAKKHVVVDLRGVTFVDPAGERLLEKFYAAGAILFGSDPMIGALIEEIKSRVPRDSEGKSIVSLPTVLLLSFLVATFLLGCAIVR